MNIELKPCPFCGSEVELIDTGLHKNYKYLIRHPAYKNDCIFNDGKTIYANKPETAAEIWNRRVNDD